MILIHCYIGQTLVPFFQPCCPAHSAICTLSLFLCRANKDPFIHSFIHSFTVSFRFPALRRGFVAERLLEAEVHGTGLRVPLSTGLAGVCTRHRAVHHGRVRRPLHHDVHRHQHGVHGHGPRRNERRTHQRSHHRKLRTHSAAFSFPNAAY